MTPAQMQLARRRLWLGITNVGFWVLAAGAGLFWLVICRAEAPGAGLLLGIGAGAIAAQAVFDFIGGVTLLPGPRPSGMTFLRGWLRGVLGHTLVLSGVGVVSAISLRFTGGFIAGIAFATLALAIGRRNLLGAIGGVPTAELAHDGEKLLTVAVKDPAFTGGIAGLGRRAKSLLPANWISTLPKPELAAESIRRRWQIANALPARAFFLILLWNLLGTFIGTQVFHLAERPRAAALLGHACWMTLWTFASLLVLPALSRKAVFAADRAAADSGHDPRAWIARFPDVVGEDGSPNAAVQTIFYPVPSTELRLRHLGQPSSGFVPGNLARSNLYYSWATFTLLGRAVHCNVGRPALWVFPPSA
jgi:hypothetical protein